MNSITISQRIQELVNEQDESRARQLANYLAIDLGVELPERRLRVLRRYKQVASSALRRLEKERSQSFVCGFLLGTLRVCDAYDARIAPDLEREAIRRARKYGRRAQADESPDHYWPLEK